MIDLSLAEELYPTNKCTYEQFIEFLNLQSVGLFPREQRELVQLMDPDSTNMIDLSLFMQFLGVKKILRTETTDIPTPKPIRIMKSDSQPVKLPFLQ